MKKQFSKNFFPRYAHQTPGRSDNPAAVLSAVKYSSTPAPRVIKKVRVFKQ